MAIVRCRECGGEVSTAAEICPHCGVRAPAAAGDAVGHDRAPVRRTGGRGGWLLALLLLLVLLALFALWYGDVVNFT